MCRSKSNSPCVSWARHRISHCLWTSTPRRLTFSMAGSGRMWRCLVLCCPHYQDSAQHRNISAAVPSRLYQGLEEPREGNSGRGSATCDHCRPLKKLNVLVLMSTDSAKFCAEPTTRKGCSTWNDTWYRPDGVLLRTTEDGSPFTRRYHGIGMAPILERLKVPLFLSKLKAPPGESR